MAEHLRGSESPAYSRSCDDTGNSLRFDVEEFGTRSCLYRYVYTNTHEHIHTHTDMLPKKWNMESAWALHEIKRINPRNMHDGFNEYVEEEKKGLWKPLYGVDEGVNVWAL